MKIQETGIRMIYHGKGVFSHPDGLALGKVGDFYHNPVGLTNAFENK